MLYISRFVGSTDVGVVDTDDGVEEIIDIDELFFSIDMLGLKVAGVLDTEGWNHIKPYQLNDTLSPLQLKYQLINCVSVTVYKSMITRISWRHTDISEPVSIRLSDFGRKCADKMLDCETRAVFSRALGNLYDCHKVTLVLDDLIDISDYSFRAPDENMHLGRKGYGVYFDLRDVTRGGLLAEVYWRMLVKNSFHGVTLHFEALDSIIDGTERKESMKEAVDCYIAEYGDVWFQLDYETMRHEFVERFGDAMICCT